MLLHAARTRAQPPRIALVLSGGGAKCACQIGVVSALEEELARLQEANPQTPLDISLVAGTSGGAINSLPIALGISRTPEGRSDLAAVWRSLDQRRIICPTWLVRLNIGLWFAVVQIVLVLAVTRLAVRVARRRGWVDGAALLVLAGLNAAVAAQRPLLLRRRPFRRPAAVWRTGRESGRASENPPGCGHGVGHDLPRVSFHNFELTTGHGLR
jgi:hypothetical protein